MWMSYWGISFDTLIIMFYKEKNIYMNVAFNNKWVSHQLGFVFYNLKSCIYIGDLLLDFLYYIHTHKYILGKGKRKNKIVA